MKITDTERLRSLIEQRILLLPGDHDSAVARSELQDVLAAFDSGEPLPDCTLRGFIQRMDDRANVSPDIRIYRSEWVAFKAAIIGGINAQMREMPKADKEPVSLSLPEVPKTYHPVGCGTMRESPAGVTSGYISMKDYDALRKVAVKLIAASRAAPSGWVSEPTEAMLEAGYSAYQVARTGTDMKVVCARIYKAMLSATGGEAGHE